MAKNNNKKPKVKEMDGRSKNVWEEKVEKLRQELPEVLSEGERYQFTWAGKSGAFQKIKNRQGFSWRYLERESACCCMFRHII